MWSYMMVRFLLILFYLSRLQGIQAQNTNLVLEKITSCNNTHNQPLKLVVAVKSFTPGSQVIEFNCSVPVPIGDNIRFILTVDVEVLKTQNWVTLIKAEDGACKTINRYLGDVFYDIERSIGIAPRSCPIPQGNYQLKDHIVDLKKLKLQHFPFGKIRLTLDGFEKSKQLLCYVIHIDSVK